MAILSGKVVIMVLQLTAILSVLKPVCGYHFRQIGLAIPLFIFLVIEKWINIMLNYIEPLMKPA